MYTIFYLYTYTQFPISLTHNFPILHIYTIFPSYKCTQFPILYTHTLYPYYTHTQFPHFVHTHTQFPHLTLGRFDPFPVVVVLVLHSGSDKWPKTLPAGNRNSKGWTWRVLMLPFYLPTYLGLPKCKWKREHDNNSNKKLSLGFL